jgi:hypothetical protein
MRSFGQDITNLSKNIENHKQTKKSSSYNEKDKVRQKIIKYKYFIIENQKH